MSSPNSLASVQESDHISRVTGYPNLAGLGGSTGKLAEALAKAQLEFKPVNKSKTAKGEKFSYKYADLNDVLGMAVPILAKHGISFMQPLRRDGDKMYVVTRIQLGDEVLEDCGLLVPHLVKPQELGTYLTYYRRYGVSTFLGIAADEDTDAVETRPDYKSSTSEQPKPKAIPRTPPISGQPPNPDTTSPANFQASESDVPSNISDKPTPQEKKDFIARLRKHIADSDQDSVKAFVGKITGTEGTTNLTTRQWKDVLEPLDAAAKEGKLKEVLE